MVRNLLNRLFGRTDSSADAINAYVGGNASGDEIKLVEQLMRDDPALEKDLATQRALVEVLGKVARVEAPRSFAVTPEMVAAARGSESGISRLAELFAPQRKLALAPMVLAGFAALTVALLTIGDITGVVEQSGRSESFSTAGAVLAERGLPGEPGAPGTIVVTEAEVAAPAVSSAAGSAADAIVVTVVVEKAAVAESDGESVPQAMRATATTPPAATLMAAEAVPAEAQILESSVLGDDADTEAQPSLEAQAPAPAGAAATPDLSVDDEVAKRAFSDSVDAAEDSELENALRAGSDSDAAAGALEGATVGALEGAGAGALEGAAAGALDGAAVGALEGAGAGALDGAGAGALEGAGAGALEDAGNGVALPIRELQVALAALALAAIGAWATLRRVRRD